MYYKIDHLEVLFGTQTDITNFHLHTKKLHFLNLFN